MRDNLVSWWKMDETSGSRADAHGSNTLTDNNTVGNGTGKQSNAGDFESGSSEYLSITDASQTGLDITGNLSISAWVRFESLPGSGNAMGILTKIGATAALRAYNFCYDNSWHSGANRLVLQTWANYSQGTIGYVSWTPSLATWYHVVVVHTSSGSGTHTFYIDGVAQTTTYTLQDVGSIQNTTASAFIGADQDSGVGRYFDGLIDEVAIWGRALSGSEVTTLYNGGSGVTYESTGATGVTVNPAAQVATFSVPAYTMKYGWTTSPSAQTATFSLPTRTVTAHWKVSPSAQTVTFSIPAYVVVGGGVAVSPSPQTATFTIPTAAILTGSIVSPDAQTLTFSVPASAVQANVQISPDVQTLTFSVPTLAFIGALWKRSVRNTGSWTRSVINNNP